MYVYRISINSGPKNGYNISLQFDMTCTKKKNNEKNKTKKRKIPASATNVTKNFLHLSTNTFPRTES